MSKPVAWRVKDFADGWILFHSEAAACAEAKEMGGNTIVEALYSPNIIEECAEVAFEWSRQEMGIAVSIAVAIRQLKSNTGG